MKIALILALARYLHGLSVEDISKPLRLADPASSMIGVPAALVLKEPNLGTAIILVRMASRCCSSRGFPGGGSCQRFGGGR